MHQFNALDIVILAVLAISVIISFMRGFVRESVSLAIWAIAVVVSIRLAKWVGAFFGTLIASDTGRYIAGFVTVFLIILLLGILVNLMLASLIEKTGISSTDRLLGIFFGVARGVLLVAVMLLFLSMLPMHSESLWAESQLAPQFKGILASLNQLIPTDINQQFNQLVGDQVASLSGSSGKKADAPDKTDYTQGMSPLQDHSS